jgi:hypothetical protein
MDSILENWLLLKNHSKRKLDLFMESYRLQKEINVKFAASAATDEDLVAVAKSGDHPAFVELWTRHS